MKVSKKAYYGLRATLAIAKAKRPISIHSLARDESLPEDYLEKIVQALRRAGIVGAKKGVDGGYTLARTTHTITAWDIIETLDGPMNIEPTLTKKIPSLNYTGNITPPGWPCPPMSHCQTNQVWRVLEHTIEKTLSSLTLEKILHQEL